MPTGRGEVKEHPRQKDPTQDELPEKGCKVCKWSSEVRLRPSEKGDTPSLDLSFPKKMEATPDTVKQNALRQRICQSIGKW